MRPVRADRRNLDIALRVGHAPRPYHRTKANLWLDLIDARDVHGMKVQEDPAPVFPDVKVKFHGESSALGDQCFRVNEAIRDHFDEYGLRVPPNLRSLITSGAMTAGDADQALAYLLRWVDIDTGEDDE